MAGPLRDPGPDAQRAVGELPGDTGPEPSVEPLPDAPVGAIDEWSMEQLHRRASEVGLEGRWEMTREQLVEALREP